MTSARNMLEASFEGYVITREGGIAGSDGEEQMPEIALRNSRPANSNRPYRGEVSAQPCQGPAVASSRFYHASMQPPSSRSLSSSQSGSTAAHASARRLISNPTTTAIPQIIPSARSVSQPSHSDSRFRPGGLYYQQRYARPNVAGPSNEVYIEEEEHKDA